MWWIERKHLFSSGPLTNCHQSNSSHNLGPLFVAWPGEEQETWEENRLRHTRYFITYLCTLITPNANIYVVILANILSTLEIPTSNCELTRHWGAGEHLCLMLRRNGGQWTREQPVDFHPSACKHLSPSPLLSSTQLHNDGGQSPRLIFSEPIKNTWLSLPIFPILLSPILTNKEWSDTDICALYL